MVFTGILFPAGWTDPLFPKRELWPQNQAEVTAGSQAQKIGLKYFEAEVLQFWVPTRSKAACCSILLQIPGDNTGQREAAALHSPFCFTRAAALGLKD